MSGFGSCTPPGIPRRVAWVGHGLTSFIRIPHRVRLAHGQGHVFSFAYAYLTESCDCGMRCESSSRLLLISSDSVIVCPPLFVVGVGGPFPPAGDDVRRFALALGSRASTVGASWSMSDRISPVSPPGALGGERALSVGVEVDVDVFFPDCPEEVDGRGTVPVDAFEPLLMSAYDVGGERRFGENESTSSVSSSVSVALDVSPSVTLSRTPATVLDHRLGLGL